MPKTNLKADLIDQICKDSIQQIQDLDYDGDGEEVDEVLDGAMEDVCLVLENRYTQPRTKVSSSWSRRISITSFLLLYVLHNIR
jgi:hypothetical protein